MAWKRRHGLAKKHPLYDRWIAMRQRCNNPNCKAFKRYGAVGINVCERWDDFAAFVEDMGPCPDGYTLERVDGSKGYSPDNCIWADDAAQVRNRSMTVWIEFDGRRQCLTDWANEMGVTFASLKERIEKWGVDRALSTPRIETRKATT